MKIMTKTTKKTRTILFSLFLLLCFENLIFAEVKDFESLSADISEGSTGYVPSPIDMSYLAKNPPKNVTKRAFAAKIPATYDMRNTGRLTPVRNQDAYRTCWSHAAMAACESNYLIRSKKGNFSGSLGDAKTLNLSEMYLAWFTYANPDTSKTFTVINDNGILNQGGNETKSTAILTRIGIVQESSMPYGESVSKSSKPGNYTRVLRVKEATFSAPSLSSGEQDKIIKQLVMDKGAVLISYYEESKYHNNRTHAYYSSGRSTTNHMVVIVGWNDNYPRNNFGIDKPKRNGAWLVRNSWGSNWGAGGYFWLSYEQYRHSGTAYTVEPVKEKLNHYGYDDLGWLCSVNVHAKRTGWAANVFQVKNSNEILREVGFYTTDNGTKYSVSVYSYGKSQPSEANLTADEPVATKSGTMDMAGYHTIKIDDVPLKHGDYFAIVLKVYTPLHDYPIAVEKYYKNYADNVVVNSGESYFSSDGKKWTDGKNFNGGSNACIKAFTVCKDSDYEDDDEDYDDEDEDYYDDECEYEYDDFDDDYDDDYDDDCEDDDWDDDCEDDDYYDCDE